jgi:hypothetical protein
MMHLGIRKIAFAAVPVLVAGAMVGPMAGQASALPRQSICSDMLTEVYGDWGSADFYREDAAAANERGDWLAWGYYSELAAEDQQDGDDLYHQYLGLGCR